MFIKVIHILPYFSCLWYPNLLIFHIFFDYFQEILYNAIV
ncbi:hypothetical protein ROSEINA2194_00486 [Roseburia inulinivorans DSM 16841]|uniref:Uncharacterized protein n=1 Tax=Roseburia inulinivorans DSM 16841 TaxID=622312 RepID=C0FP34_9FIRM|nr:hypothetical protein ROSEINA2194_00486 [Roseburia inulinivorans DSM 16841]